MTYLIIKDNGEEYQTDDFSEEHKEFINQGYGECYILDEDCIYKRWNGEDFEEIQWRY